jgi:hypothetical protein
MPYVKTCSNRLRSNHEAFLSLTVGKSTVEPLWTGGFTKQWPEGRDRWVRRVPRPACAMVKCLSALVDGGASATAVEAEEGGEAEAMVALLLCGVCGRGWRN